MTKKVYPTDLETVQIELQNIYKMLTVVLQQLELLPEGYSVNDKATGFLYDFKNYVPIIGSANGHNLKTSEFGAFYHDKSRYSNKEVETFRYYENVIEVLRGLMQKAI